MPRSLRFLRENFTISCNFTQLLRTKKSSPYMTGAYRLTPMGRQRRIRYDRQRDGYACVEIGRGKKILSTLVLADNLRGERIFLKG